MVPQVGDVVGREELERDRIVRFDDARHREMSIGNPRDHMRQMRVVRVHNATSSLQGLSL